MKRNVYRELLTMTACIEVNKCCIILFLKSNLQIIHEWFEIHIFQILCSSVTKLKTKTKSNN